MLVEGRPCHLGHSFTGDFNFRGNLESAHSEMVSGAVTTTDHPGSACKHCSSPTSRINRRTLRQSPARRGLLKKADDKRWIQVCPACERRDLFDGRGVALPFCTADGVMRTAIDTQPEDVLAVADFRFSGRRWIAALPSRTSNNRPARCQQATAWSAWLATIWSRRLPLPRPRAWQPGGAPRRTPGRCDASLDAGRSGRSQRRGSHCKGVSPASRWTVTRFGHLVWQQAPADAGSRPVRRAGLRAQRRAGLCAQSEGLCFVHASPSRFPPAAFSLRMGSLTGADGERIVRAGEAECTRGVRSTG